MSESQLKELVENLVKALEGCRLTGPLDNQKQLQSAIKAYREVYPR